MQILTEMVGVSASGTSTGNAFLYRDALGKLVLVGDFINVFQLLEWIDKNPLAQFRNIGCGASAQDDEPFTPHHLFAHLFDAQGKVL